MCVSICLSLMLRSRFQKKMKRIAPISKLHWAPLMQGKPSLPLSSLGLPMCFSFLVEGKSATILLCGPEAVKASGCV